MSSANLRSDLFVTTALLPSPALEAKARGFAHELNAPFVPRRDNGLPKVFASKPDAVRALVVQVERLLLVNRDQGGELFYHPNTAFLRMGTILQGGRDLLLTAAELKPGDSVLDATLGYASEAVLCAYAVGDSGEVHGIEAVPELGIVVREGLKSVTTARTGLNDAMRRVRVVHLGDHLDFLRACPPARYDVVCFDPFFEEILANSETFAPIRAFGQHSPLLAEALHEAQRVARRRVLVKAVKWSDTLQNLGITESCASRGGKVCYGILPALGVG